MADYIDPNRIEASEMKRLIDFTYSAHQEHNTRKDYRQNWTVPYIVHPLWCAVMLTNDAGLPLEDRKLGYQALLLHDVLEDTNLPLPKDLDPRVREIVQDMTHETWEEEQAHEIATPLGRLLKLCDKIATVYDEAITTKEKWPSWLAYTNKIFSQVEKDYPKSKIVVVARAILNAPIQKLQ